MQCITCRKQANQTKGCAKCEFKGDPENIDRIKMNNLSQSIQYVLNVEYKQIINRCQK